MLTYYIKCGNMQLGLIYNKEDSDERDIVL